MTSLDKLLAQSIPELRERFVDRARPVPKGLVEALETDKRQGAHQLAKQIRGWVPIVFILSTLVGVVGTVIQGASVLFGWSGVMFGVAFAGLGVETWRSTFNS